MVTARRISFYLSWLLFVILLASASAAFAQATGSIRGTVTDTSGAAVSGASVSAEQSGTAAARKAVTNQEGIYVFPDLPIGTYTLHVTQQGFQTQNRTGLQLLTGQTLDIGVQLSVGSETNYVEVNSAAPLIQTASSSVQASVDQKQMQDLPLNRSEEHT